ncbi:MAG: S8 family peptidase [Bacteroidales bacterium]|nr:S8 family peptidase [Candidatus Sodaliphilus aphodohippi]
MSKRIHILLLTILIAVVTVKVLSARQSGLTARSRVSLYKPDNSGLKTRSSRGGNLYYPAFVTVEGSDAIATLNSLGVRINARFGNILTVQIPQSGLPSVLANKGIESVGIAQPLSLNNDSARLFAHVDEVHNSNEHPYMGDGVVVGMIDVGIDFNHINFKDDYGNNRICAVYMPEDTTGTSPVIDGDTLPGSCYEEAAQIAALTSDGSNDSHGTHTTGTAAGSFSANGLHGVAPHARIVACSIPNEYLTDINIANSIKYIVDYADRCGMPLVINMSLGSSDGPHDGTSLLCRIVDEVSGPGRICVLSASNSGHRNHVLDHTFSSLTDTIYTCFGNYSGHEGGWIPGSVSLWSVGANEHFIGITAVSKSSGKILHTWTHDDMTMGKDSVYVLNGAVSKSFSQYFTEGELKLASTIESCNGHFHSYIEVNLRPVDNDIALGFKLSSLPGTRLTGWGDTDVVFTRNGHSYMTRGSSVMSISDLVTGDSAISVGAYCSRMTMPLADGTYLSNSRAVLNDIAYFSSYGPDVRGIARPDVVAPGYSLVSSVSRYDSTTMLVNAWRAPGIIENDVEYPYGSQYGTSMSAPVVTGAIALWLQANPHLGPADVRKVFEASSIRDAYVTGSNKSRWGSGKLDVSAGLKYLINTPVADTKTSKIKVDLANSGLVMKILDIPQSGAVIYVCDMSGRIVIEKTLPCGSCDVDMSDIASGCYLLHLVAGNEVFNKKIIIQ